MRLRTYIIGGTILVIACAAFVAWLLPVRRVAYSNNIDSAVAATTTMVTTTAPVFVVTHVSTPDPVKGIYFTSWAAGTPSFQNKMWGLLDGSTELNSIVIDVKDYSGRIGFEVTDPSLVAMRSAQNRIPDIEQFLGKLHDKGVYVIGRVAVFQDPYAVLVRPEWAVRDIRTGKPWKDASGAYWLDPDSRDVWAYITAIAKQAYAVGFDEINFDYIRFPSEGALSNAVLTKSASTTRAEVIRDFFSYLHDELSSLDIPISVDLFGQTTSEETDMGIGQVIEDAFPYFDFIDPMVYPSHFANGFIGYAHPALHPYEVVKYSMDQGVARLVAASSTPSKLRPWLQAFDLGAVYTPAMVQAEKQATYDAGLSSWLLWNAGAVYNKEGVISHTTSKTASTTIATSTNR